jgi:hypothetical protein
MVRDLPRVETDSSLSREQILGLAAQEMQRWEREHKPDTQHQANSAGKVLVLCGVAILALLIFVCGYVLGQHASDLTGSSPAKVHETIKP